MNTEPQPSKLHKILLWVGRVITALPVAGLLFSAYAKFTLHEEVIKAFEKFGVPLDLLRPIGTVELICTVLYIIPQTAILGAILLTGYLGGAVLTHLRVSDGFAAPIIMGVLIWLGLLLRDARLRPLLPLRRV